MRADEPMTSVQMYAMLEDGTLLNYINKVRYERLMEKARHLRYVHDDAIYSSRYYAETCLRIAESYEAMAKRIKEGM